MQRGVGDHLPNFVVNLRRLETPFDYRIGIYRIGIYRMREMRYVYVECPLSVLSEPSEVRGPRRRWSTEHGDNSPIRHCGGYRIGRDLFASPSAPQTARRR